MGQDEPYEEQKENLKNANREVKIWQRERQKKTTKTLSPRGAGSQQIEKLDIIEKKMRDK